MDDLSRAISQFYPSAKGGMYGGSSTPPGPFGDPSFIKRIRKRTFSCLVLQKDRVGLDEIRKRN